MEVSKSPISLLVKSFIKKNKIFAISLCIISISMVLLISYAGMVYQNIYSRYKTAKQLYGEYQFEIQKLTKQEANQIKKDSGKSPHLGEILRIPLFQDFPASLFAFT